MSKIQNKQTIKELHEYPESIQFQYTKSLLLAIGFICSEKMAVTKDYWKQTFRCGDNNYVNYSNCCGWWGKVGGKVGDKIFKIPQSVNEQVVNELNMVQYLVEQKIKFIKIREVELHG